MVYPLLHNRERSVTVTSILFSSKSISFPQLPFKESKFVLILYHTVQRVNDPEDEASKHKQWEKEEM